MATGESSSSTGTANIVEYDANKNAVGSVTVFQTNRAEVKRRIEVELKDGQNDVEVKNLPTCLEEDSIRVDGLGNATIFDVIYHPPPPYDSSKYESALADIKAREKEITDQLEILNQQAEVLKQYSTSLSSADADCSKLETFLDVYSSRQAKINEASNKLNDELKTVEAQVEGKRKAIDGDEESVRKRGTRVTIVVLAEGAGPAELSITYVVSSAWWKPQYDLRASVASDSKDKSTIALHYRASISQKTGEDWKGVALTLSTASPLQGTKVPTLNPFWIGEKETAATASVTWEPLTTMMVSQANVVTPSGFPRQKDRAMRKRFARATPSQAAPPPPGFFRSVDSEATVGAVSTVFAIPGMSTIPSDSDTVQQAHKVSVAELNFDTVDLEWITVPKDTPSVFLRCRVKNTSKYVLLPGQANVFLNSSFVAKSAIPHVSQQEIFPCSLGVDPAIRVTYHPLSVKSRSAGGSLLSAKLQYSASEQKITIKNTRLSAVPRLLVKEQVPVSRDAKINVNVLEPSNLSQKGREVVLKDGVSVRWTNQKVDEDSLAGSGSAEDLDADSAQGMLEWICNIQPGASVDLTLSWEISAPKGVVWTKQ